MSVTITGPHQPSRLSEEFSPLISLAKPPVDAGYPTEDKRLSTEAGRVNCGVARTFSFGPFQLLPAQRLLLEAEEPLRLGSRALDILIALIERPGELVSKEELMARVWPKTTVGEGKLTGLVARRRGA